MVTSYFFYDNKGDQLLMMMMMNTQGSEQKAELWNNFLFEGLVASFTTRQRHPMG